MLYWSRSHIEEERSNKLTTMAKKTKKGLRVNASKLNCQSGRYEDIKEYRQSSAEHQATTRRCSGFSTLLRL